MPPSRRSELIPRSVSLRGGMNLDRKKRRELSSVCTRMGHDYLRTTTDSHQILQSGWSVNPQHLIAMIDFDALEEKI